MREMAAKMTFKKWYDQHEWFHDPDEELKEIWDGLIEKGLSADEVAEVFDSLHGIIRSEYGD